MHTHTTPNPSFLFKFKKTSHNTLKYLKQKSHTAPQMLFQKHSQMLKLLRSPRSQSRWTSPPLKLNFKHQQFQTYKTHCGSFHGPEQIFRWGSVNPLPKVRLVPAGAQHKLYLRGGQALNPRRRRSTLRLDITPHVSNFKTS